MDSRRGSVPTLRRPPDTPHAAAPPTAAPAGAVHHGSARLSGTPVAGRLTVAPRPALSWLADRRGLTAAGAVVLGVILATAGVIADVTTGSGLRGGFAGCFLVACGLTALLVHREDLVAAVVLPPLLYLGAAVAAGLATPVAAGLSRRALELATALIVGAPVLLTGTLLALLLAALRGAVAAGRRRSHPH